MVGILDQKFLDSLTFERVQKEFNDLVLSKTDIISKEIRIARGCDNIDHTTFSNDISHHASIICEKGRTGKYIFSPFREKETPKPPYNQLADAIKAGISEGKKDKYIRTLSISTIQDTIFQKLIADVVCDYAEQIFAETIDLHSYGYREGKSSKMAVRKIRRFIDKGYHYVLDGDIKKFFDEIDHRLLTEKMRFFFGTENQLIQTYLYRFIHVDKIPVGKAKEYHYPGRAEKREQGIPQGGVLSGLLANVFLYNFDLYVAKVLMPKYGFQYFRYADDFVLLFQDESSIKEVYQLLHDFISAEKLVLHPIGEKTKFLDLSPNGKQTLDFLGFGISPQYLRAKGDNYKKFKNKVLKLLEDIDTGISDDSYFNKVIGGINRKIVGLEDLIEQENGLCLVCNRLIKKRSWIGYFMMVNDVRQLRNIDTMIRTEIYKDYHRRYKRHIRKKELYAQTYGRLKSIVEIYYKYKKQIRTHEKNGYCNCDKFFDPETHAIKMSLPEK